MTNVLTIILCRQKGRQPITMNQPLLGQIKLAKASLTSPMTLDMIASKCRMMYVADWLGIRFSLTGIVLSLYDPTFLIAVMFTMFGFFCKAIKFQQRRSLTKILAYNINQTVKFYLRNYLRTDTEEKEALQRVWKKVEDCVESCNNLKSEHSWTKIKITNIMIVLLTMIRCKNLVMEVLKCFMLIFTVKSTASQTSKLGFVNNIMKISEIFRNKDLEWLEKISAGSIFVFSTFAAFCIQLWETFIIYDCDFEEKILIIYAYEEVLTVLDHFEKVAKTL